MPKLSSDKRLVLSGIRISFIFDVDILKAGCFIKVT